VHEGSTRNIAAESEAVARTLRRRRRGGMRGRIVCPGNESKGWVPLERWALNNDGRSIGTPLMELRALI
jgi:hypothetical protein